LKGKLRQPTLFDLRTFQGTVDENSVKAFCVETKIEFGDFVKTTVTIEILYEYPLLFDVSDNG
jgi:hypothetical protein